MIVRAGQADLLDQVRDVIVAHFHPIRIILFGSRARGDARLDSDLDLLVVMPDATDRRRTAIEIHELLRDLTVPKDVIVTTPEEIRRRGDVIGTALRPALREGKVIFEAA